MHRIIFIVSLCATSALAQPVWRCGNDYGAQPCEGGARVGGPAPVTSAEAARARAIGKTDAKLAAALEQERLKREKAAPKAVIPPAPAPVAAASAPKQGKKKNKEPEHLTAVLPAPKKK